MSAAIEPCGGWPAELAEGSGKMWRAWCWNPGRHENIAAADIRESWRYVASFEDGYIPVGTPVWSVESSILKRHGLIRYNRATRRWEALRVPA